MIKPEVIYFEGLPRSGKSTLTGLLVTDYPMQLQGIAEYVHPVLITGEAWNDQNIFIKNDEMKYRMARASTLRCLVDRGHLSTILYSHAYQQINADRDLKFIDDWYFGTILPNMMLPDMYVLLDIKPETSLQRRIIPPNINDMWSYVETLAFARDRYPKYMAAFEPKVPVVTLDSESLPISELKIQLTNLLGLKQSKTFSKKI